MNYTQFKQLIFYGLFSFLPSIILAQADLEDLEKVSKTYKNARSYRIDLQYTIYSNYETRDIADRFTMNVLVDGSNYYYKGTENEMLVNDQYSLFIDHTSKMMLIGPHKKKSEQTEKWSKLTADSLLQKIVSQVSTKKPQIRSQLKELSEQEKLYVFNYSNGVFKSVKIYYDPTLYTVRKMVLFYREQMEMVAGQPKATPRMEINYVQTDLHPEFDKMEFSEKKFADVRKNGSLELSAEIKNYQVINHLRK